MRDATPIPIRPATKARRVTLTKEQALSAEGAELILLCDSFTADGKLDHTEIRGLDKWLERNKTSPLPAIQFLIETVDNILSDGVVTAKEATELYKALERILPADIRHGAVSRRKQLESERVAALEQDLARRENRQADPDGRRRSMAEKGEIAIVDLYFHVAGVTHEGRSTIIDQHAREGSAVYLIRDRCNRFSGNAIAVFLPNGMQIGFVPETKARNLAPLFDNGHLHLAYIVRFFEMGATGVSCPMIEGGIYVPHSDFPGALTEQAAQAAISGADRPTVQSTAAFSTRTAEPTLRLPEIPQQDPFVSKTLWAIGVLAVLIIVLVLAR